MSIEVAVREVVTQVLNEVLPDLLAKHLEALAQRPTKLAYTLREAAQQSSLSEKHLYGLLRSGTLRGIRAGKGAWIITHADLAEYLQSAPQVPLQPTNTAPPGVKAAASQGRR